MVKNNLLIILGLCGCMAWADSLPVQTAQAIKAAPNDDAVIPVRRIDPKNPPTKTIQPLELKTATPSLDEVDQDLIKLQKIQREISIAKAQNDLNKAQNPNSNSNKSSGDNSKIPDKKEMKANNILISNTYKRASLNFSDGQTLDVELGSVIGKYKVQDISMQGVSLIASECKKSICVDKKVFIPRTFDLTPKTPTPITTSSYKSDRYTGFTPPTTVPPIINDGN